MDMDRVIEGLCVLRKHTTKTDCIETGKNIIVVFEIDDQSLDGFEAQRLIELGWKNHKSFAWILE